MSCATFNITLATSSNGFQLDGTTPLQVIVERTSFDLEMLSTGPRGTSATVQVGSVTASAPGSQPTITNSGTPLMAVLDFVLPRGEQGPQGIQGEQGPKGDTGNAGSTGSGYAATSSTSMISGAGGGAKTFTTQAGLAYIAGCYVRIASASSPSNYMAGYVNSYSGTSMVVNVIEAGSTGATLSDWVISLAGPTGADGADGVDGADGAGYRATSSTSLSSNTGTNPITFTTQAGLAYVAGDYVRLIAATNSNNWFEGTITSYSGTTMQLAWNAAGSTTSTPFNSWNLSLFGKPGADGQDGAGGAIGHYGTFYDSTTQSVSSTTSAYSVTLSTTGESNGISIGSPSSRIVVSHAGTYDVHWSAQFENSSVSDQDVKLWIRKNGSDVVGSSGIVSVPSSHGGINGHTVGGWNYVLTLLANDYIELVWQASSTDVKMAYYSAGTSPTSPSAASMIVTVTQVMYTQASEIPSGTGLVSVTGGAYDAPSTLSDRIAADAANLRTQLGLGSLATQSSVSYSSLTGIPSSFTPSAHASTHGSGGSDQITIAQSQVTSLTTDLAAKAPLASPALTGAPTAPTATSGTNTTQIATTAFVATAIAGSSVIAQMKFLE